MAAISLGVPVYKMPPVKKFHVVPFRPQKLLD